MKPKLQPPLHHSVRQQLDAVVTEPLPREWLCILQRLEEREPRTTLHAAMVELQLGIADLQRQVWEMKTFSQIVRKQVNDSWTLLRRVSVLASR